MPVAPISYSRRLTSLAEQDPDRRAITCGDRSITRSELESAANRLARDLLEGGAAAGDMITVALDDKGEISNVINNTGGPTATAPHRVTPKVTSFP